MIIILLASFIPSGLIFWLLLSVHKGDKEYRKECFSLLGFGVLSAIPVFLLSLLCNILINVSGIADSSELLMALLKDFIVVAASEELIKYLTANRALKKRGEKTSWLDTVSFMAIAAMGFELFESFVYMFSTNIGQIIVRGVLAMHVAWGLGLGYFVGKARDTKKMFGGIAAFIITFVMHGSYDFFLGNEFISEDYALISVLIAFITLVELIVMIVFVFKAKKKEKYNAPLVSQSE